MASALTLMLGLSGCAGSKEAETTAAEPTSAEASVTTKAEEATTAAPTT